MSTEQSERSGREKPMTTEPTHTSVIKPVHAEDLLCGMESVSRDGNCNRPATHIWTHPDGTTPVCKRCILSVWVCGGQLTEIKPGK